MNIIGRLTRDAKINTLSDERQVVNFSIATDESYRNKNGERIKQTTYFDCSYWVGPSIAKYLTKGKLVELSGRVSARAWVSQNGEPRATLNFHTSQIKLHSGDTASKEKINVSTEPAVNAQDTPDDLPF